MNRGTIATIVMVLVGVSMAGYAWWHQTQRGKRIHAFWGTDIVQLIRHAPQVEVFWLSREGQSANPQLDIGGKSFQVTRKMNVTNVRGLVHARHALILDFNFQWKKQGRTAVANWTHALRFIDGDRRCTLVITSDETIIQLLDGPYIHVHDKIHEGLLEFFGRLDNP